MVGKCINKLSKRCSMLLYQIRAKLRPSLVRTGVAKKTELTGSLMWIIIAILIHIKGVQYENYSDDP